MKKVKIVFATLLLLLVLFLTSCKGNKGSIYSLRKELETKDTRVQFYLENRETLIIETNKIKDFVITENSDIIIYIELESGIKYYIRDFDYVYINKNK